jgi:ankyrin repeat protein
MCNKYVRDIKGVTPLMAAAAAGRGDVVDALLANGADPKTEHFQALFIPWK